MFQQQPMRNQPRPQAPQRPGRALMPRHPGMGMQPPQAQQRGLQQMFQPMGAAQQQAGARGGGIQGCSRNFFPDLPHPGNRSGSRRNRKRPWRHSGSGQSVYHFKYARQCSKSARRSPASNTDDSAIRTARPQSPRNGENVQTAEFR